MLKTFRTADPMCRGFEMRDFAGGWRVGDLANVLSATALARLPGSCCDVEARATLRMCCGVAVCEETS